MTWQEMLAQAEQLFAAVKIILEKGDEASVEEKESVAQRIEDAQKLKARAMQLKVASEGSAPLPRPGDDPPTDDPLVGPSSQTEEPPASRGVGEFKDWGTYLSAVWQKMTHNVDDSRLKWLRDTGPEGQQKQMSGSAGASGGFLIPVQFMAELQAVMAESSIVRQFATVIRMARRQIAIPVLDQTQTLGAGLPTWFGGMRFYWADEGEQKTTTEPTFRRVNLVAKKLIGYTYASDELLDDSAISLADFLSGPLGFAGGIAWMEDYAFLRGVGGGQPRGIVNAPVTLAPNRQAAGAISYIDCINMLQRFLPSARGRWVITQSAMANLIQMSGPAGNPSYVWQPNARDGVPGFLFGLPVHWCEKMPALGTRGDILLADMRYYLIGDRQATTIESSTAPRWQYDETSWRAVHRVDGQPWLSAPLTYQDQTTQVSPFVVLDPVSS